MLTFNHLKKNLKKPADDCKVIRLALLADSASQFITQALKGYGIEYKIDYKIFEADYNQIDRQVFDPSSELYSYEPDFVIIIRSSERLLKSFYKKNTTEKNSFAEDEIAYINSLYSAISNQLKAKVIANTYVEINDGIFGNYATKTTLSFQYQVKKLNLLLMDNSRELKNLFLFDLSALINTKGYINTFDPKMYVNADMVFGIDILPDMAKNLHQIIQAVTGAFKKCIILDLDNTLWGGIIGDDGIEGIHLGELGIGKAFTELQLWVKELIRRGIVVAVCSKNSEDIAKEPFTNHPDMVLRLEDIAVFVASWENKVDSIKHIQSILNIGLDSMVFLDDNPFEREMVAQAIPDLTIPPLPEDPAEYLPYLRSLNLFETASFTEEDETRTKQYQEEAKRSVLQQSFANEDEFLQNLSMESE
ncbi:MAG: HAD-IIIC family phosphatase, partial [Ferruginibacter sp.]